MDRSVAVLSSSSFALYEIANVLSIILFNLLASFPYSQLLTVHAYLSGTSVFEEVRHEEEAWPCSGSYLDTGENCL